MPTEFDTLDVYKNGMLIAVIDKATFGLVQSTAGFITVWRRLRRDGIPTLAPGPERENAYTTKVEYVPCSPENINRLRVFLIECGYEVAIDE